VITALVPAAPFGALAASSADLVDLVLGQDEVAPVDEEQVSAALLDLTDLHELRDRAVHIIDRPQLAQLTARHDAVAGLTG